MHPGICLQLYFPEGTRHGHLLLHEWLLKQARDCGIEGGSVFRAIAGFGRHGKMHYGHFFETAGQLPIEVRFVTTRDLGQRLLDVLDRENVRIFCVQSDVNYGWTGKE